MMQEIGITNKSPIKKLTQAPKRDKKKEMPHYEGYVRNAIQQADILHLPNDKGYKYCLGVIDTATRHCDATPLKSKTASAVLEGFKQIYKRKKVSFPKTMMQIDAGSEFKGVVKKYFESKGIVMRIGKIGRHRQQALAEWLNYVIDLGVNTKMNEKELKTGKTNREWTKYLPKIITTINKYAKKPTSPSKTSPFIHSDKRIDLIDQGTKVRVPLDEPHGIASKKKLHGKFRVGDLRWETKPTKIDRVLLRPNQPVMYLTKKYKTVPYTKKQLQIVR